MTVTLDLSPELETELRHEAAREGLDPDGFVLSTLRERLRRSSRVAPHLSRTETALLETISATWPAETQARFNSLVVKRRAHKITKSELAELTSLTDKSETLAAERVRAVGELARLRGLSFDEMWRLLGINGLTPTGCATIPVLRLNRNEVINLRDALLAAGQHTAQAASDSTEE